MVRFKSKQHTIPLFLSDRSQFHYGSIQISRERISVSKGSNWSQFHYGSIQIRLTSDLRPQRSQESQFHYGSIQIIVNRHFGV